jgi:hypothetical protein
MVVAKHFDAKKKKNNANAFDKAIMLYLESLMGLKNIGNQVIYQLCEQKMLTMMLYHDFEHCCCQLLIYVMQNVLLHCTLNLPTPQELVEQLFLVQLKAPQAKYAKISKDIEQDADKLCTFFEGCHIKDVTDDTFQKLKNSIAANCKVKKVKDD